MTNRLKFLLTILIITIWYVGIKNYITNIKDTLEIQMAEKEIIIYQSINNNTNLISNLIK